MAVASRVRVLRVLPPSTRITRPPLQLRPGLSVTVGERSDAWPAFLLVRTAHGACGWVPERYLGRERPRTRATRFYDTRVVEPGLGETLEVLARDDPSGWIWCRDAEGSEGWYPIDHVEAL